MIYISYYAQKKCIYSFMYIFCKFEKNNYENKYLEGEKMLTIFFRSIMIYILVLLVMRLMGKREIGQLQPFELAISIMIADLASIPMADTGIPITNGIIPIFGLLIMHLIISQMNLKSIKMREFICGRPSFLIYRGKIDEKIMRKERFTINELEERLRDKDIFNIGDVEYAILETSGQVNIILKPEKRQVTLEDMNLESEYTGIPYDLIIDGKVMHENLRKLGKDTRWLQNQLNKYKTSAEKILIMTIDAKDEVYLQEKDKKRKE